MSNELYRKITEERISDPEQLSAAEQAMLGANAEALLAIQENLALAELATLTPPAPSREAMLSAAIESGRTPPRVNPGYYRWSRVARAAVAVVLVLAAVGLYNIKPVYKGDELTGVSLEPAQQAWASKPGVLMEFETQTSDEELARSIADSVDAKLRESLASQYYNLQVVHGELALDRDLLRGHEVYLDSLQHAGHSRLPGDKEMQARHEQLIGLLRQYDEKLGQAEVNDFHLRELTSKHASDLDSRLQVLDEQLSSLQLENFRYLRRDITRNDDGRCVISVAMPRLAIELSDIRTHLDELEEIESIHLENAVFFVRDNGQEGQYFEFDEANSSADLHNKLIYKKYMDASHNSELPNQEIIKTGLKSVMKLGDGDNDFEFEFEGTNGHSSLVFRHGDEIIEHLNSGSLGHGMVWYSIPENEELHNLHFNEWHVGDPEINSDGVIKSITVEMETGENGNHHGAVFMTEGISLEGIESTISLPDLVSVGELEGKIITVIGDAPESRNVEVITETDGSIRVIKIVVNGEIIKVLRIEDGDVEVVVTDAQEPGK